MSCWSIQLSTTAESGMSWYNFGMGVRTFNCVDCGREDCQFKGRTHLHIEGNSHMQPYEFPNTKEEGYRIKPRKTMLKYIVSPLATIAIVVAVNFVVPVIKEHRRIEAERDAAMVSSLPPQWQDAVYIIDHSDCTGNDGMFKLLGCIRDHKNTLPPISREQAKFISGRTGYEAIVYTEMMDFIK